MKQLHLFKDLAENPKSKKSRILLGPRSKPIGYEKYIRSSDWRKKRERALKLFGRKCKKCGCEKNLEVHHLNYDNLYYESTCDVEILCTSCHKPADFDRKLEKSYDTWLRNMVTMLMTTITSLRMRNFSIGSIAVHKHKIKKLM